MVQIDEFLSLALYCRDNLNPYLFNYVYSVALLHRPDTKGVPLPPLIKIFPDKFMGGDTFVRIQERFSILITNQVGLFSHYDMLLYIFLE